jgi:hypothetical protein
VSSSGTFTTPPSSTPGLDLTRTLDSAGYTVVYSTTRPSYTHGATRAWLASRDFPAGRALLSRPYLHEGHHPAPAWQVKRGHARAVTNKHQAWLTAFVDDDPAITDQLRASGIPALDAATLVAGGVDSLRHALHAPQRVTAEAAAPGAR